MGITGAATGLVAGPPAKKEIDKALTPDVPPISQAAPPPSPTSDDPATRRQTEAELAAARDRERKQRGRAATLLTGAGGLEGAPSVSRRTLLGA